MRRCPGVRIESTYRPPARTLPSRHIDFAMYDWTPDACWRCDAAPGEGDVGLCPPCGEALRG